MQGLEQVEYKGHTVVDLNFTDFFESSDTKEINKSSIELSIELKITDRSIEQDREVYILTSLIRVTATIPDKKLFSLESKFLCFFQSADSNYLNETFLSENFWFFKKFLERSAKQVLENYLSQTLYKHMPIPDF
jgi:hypothetical protein